VALIAAGFGVSHVLRPAEVIPPTVPEAELAANGWVRVDESTETVVDDTAGPVTVQAEAATVRYENEALANRIVETEATVEYLGQTTTEPLGDHLGSEFDRSIGVFTATKVDVTPHVDELPGGLGRAEVMDPIETRAKEQFEQQLRGAGLANVRQVETAAFEVDTGQEATRFEYRATFAFEGRASPSGEPPSMSPAVKSKSPDTLRFGTTDATSSSRPASTPTRATPIP